MDYNNFNDFSKWKLHNCIITQDYKYTSNYSLKFISNGSYAITPLLKTPQNIQLYYKLSTIETWGKDKWGNELFNPVDQLFLYYSKDCKTWIKINGGGPDGGILPPRHVQPHELNDFYPSNKVNLSLYENIYLKLERVCKSENVTENFCIDNVVIENKIKLIKVNVVISAYEAAEFIEECLDSIKNQTYPVHKILLGIDGCQKTFEKIKQIHHKYPNLEVYYNTENKGKYITVNTLIDLVPDDEYIITFDADDVMYPDMVSKMSVDTSLKVCNDGVIFINKQLFKKVGGYRDWKCAADTELLTRLSKITKINRIEILYFRKEHPNQLTKRPDTGLGSQLRNEYKTIINKVKNSNEYKIEFKKTELKKIENFNSDVIKFTPTKHEHTIPSIKNEVSELKYFIQACNIEMGFMLIAFGISYDKIGVHCAKSIRKFSSLPIIVHTNLPKHMRDNEWNNINNIEFIHHPNLNDTDNKIIKTQLSKYTKFYKTLYMDVDSKVLSERFLEPFEYLDHYDIVSPFWKHYTIEDIEKLSKSSKKFEKFLYICKKFNIKEADFIAGGLCYFKKNKNADNFFDTFHNLWKETGSLVDMPALNGAYFLNRSILKIISNNEYNNYNSSIIMSMHDSSKNYNELKDFTRRRYDDNKNIWLFCKQGSTKLFKKPKICFIYDVENWAFYNMSYEIKMYLDDKYDIDIIRYDRFKNQNIYDVIITFSPKVQPISKTHNDNIICGISSHFYNNNDIKDYSFIYTNDIGIYNNIPIKDKYYIPNGVNTKFFTHNRTKINDYNHINIGAVGSIKRKEHKGKYRIEEICTKLNNEHNIKVYNMSLFINPENALTIDDIKEYYKNIDIFVISSISETGPNTLLEAMSMGIPVVTNNVGLASELITNGITGYMVDSFDDIEGYINAIKSLIFSEEIYRTISTHARKRVEKFDWSIISKEFDNMIRKFLESKK